MPSLKKEIKPSEDIIVSDFKRAKIFMPFDALKGFREAIKEKEKIVVPKKEMTEDDYNKLNLAFQRIKKGSMVKVIYYSKDEYIEYTGMVSEVNESARYIKIVKLKISLDDIKEVNIIE